MPKSKFYISRDVKSGNVSLATERKAGGPFYCYLHSDEPVFYRNCFYFKPGPDAISEPIETDKVRAIFQGCCPEPGEVVEVTITGKMVKV